jgi:DNA-binding MarR family transcriptional regulator
VVEPVEIVGLNLKWAFWSTFKRYSRPLKEFGLTPMQFFILEMLWKNEGSSQQRIADDSFCDKSTIVHLIDKLEEAGFVWRISAPEDRRMHRLFLSPKAKDLYPEASKRIGEVDKELRERFSEEDLIAFGKVLKGLQR